MLRFLKILFILIFGAVCLGLASGYAEEYAAAASAKEKTLAEAVMQSRLEAELKKAEEKAEKELEEQGRPLVTEILETKPPVTETEAATEETTASETETEPVTETQTEAVTEETSVPETETEAQTQTEPLSENDEIITEFTRGGLLPEDRTNIPVRSMFTLSESERETVIQFLIDHYFLDGYKYSSEETRPELKEKKLLAAKMENGVIETVNMIFGSLDINDISALLTADYGKMKSDVEEIRDEFKENYADAASYGEEFAALYEDSLKYFDRLIKAFDNIEDTSRKYQEASNPLLAIGLLTNSFNDVILPEIMGVLENSFDLVEASQEIFLEGTQGTQLLTRDEVKDIISDPALIL